VPEGNTDIAKKAAAPLATISSHTDPYPHYLMAGACGGAAYHSYANLNNPRMAAIKLAFGAAYLWAGCVPAGLRLLSGWGAMLHVKLRV